MMQPNQSPYHRGAEAGMRFGIHLSAIFTLMVLSSYVAVASLVNAVLIISLPFMLYKSLHQSALQLKRKCTVSELWMQGIMTVICGALVCSAVTMVYLRLINPEFMTQQVTSAIDTFQTMGLGESETAKVLSNMIKYNAVPTASDFTFSMFWLTVATGCIASLPLAILARNRKKKSPSQQSFVNENQS